MQLNIQQPQKFGGMEAHNTVLTTLGSAVSLFFAHIAHVGQDQLAGFISIVVGLLTSTWYSILIYSYIKKRKNAKDY